MKKLIAVIALAALLVCGTVSGICAADNAYIQGDKSYEIAAVQAVLKKNKYYSGECNGIFGRDTRLAIEAFCQDKNVQTNGEIDLTLLKKLGLHTGATAKNSGIITSSKAKLLLTASTKGLVLTTLVKDSYVEVIKNKSGWSLVRMKDLGVEGYVQTSYMTVDKIVEVPEYHGEIPVYSLTRGDSNADVTRLQERLAQLGYYNTTATGTYGSITYMAVKQFQLDNNIEANGVATLQTMQIAFSNNVLPRWEAGSSCNTYILQPSLVLDENSDIGNRVAEYSQVFLGKKYVLGATGPNSFDCSALVRRVYSEFGIELQRTAYYQGYYSKASKIKKIKDLQVGDAVFFNTNAEDDDLCDHVGIYLGEGRFLHASSSMGEVVISDINVYYWRDIFSWGIRYVELAG